MIATKTRYKKTIAVLLMLSMLFMTPQSRTAYAAQCEGYAAGTAATREGCGAKSDFSESKGLSWDDIWNFLNGEESQEEKPEHNDSSGRYAKVKIKVAEQYRQAFSVLRLVNEERKKKGLGALKMDQSLLDAAMLRAAELSLYFGHTRPNGKDCFTASDLMSAENIAAGQKSADSVMRAWMNSSGHRANILAEHRKSIGVGCVEVNGVLYWVQNFGNNVSAKAKPGAYADKTRSRNIKVSTSRTYYRPRFSLSSDRTFVGGTISVKATWYNGFVTVPISGSSLNYKSMKTSVCAVSKGKIRGRSAGKTKVKIYFPGYEKGAVSKQIRVL